MPERYFGTAELITGQHFIPCASSRLPSPELDLQCEQINAPRKEFGEIWNALISINP